MELRKILYISGSYYPAPGGSEQTMHSLMKHLSQRGYACQVLTRKEYKQKSIDYIDGVAVTRIASEDLERDFNKELIRSKPDVIMTQLTWSDRVIELANISKIPVIHFVRSVGGNLDLSDKSPYRVEIIISNSEVTQRFIKETWGRESVIIYPIIDPEQFQAKTFKARYITIINPLKVKGGDIFKEIAKSLPNKEFLAVKGWTHLKDKEGENWDMKKMQEMADAFKDLPHIPEEVDFSDQKNIKVVGPFENMKAIYGQTKILVVPSLWEETFGRVVVEAMLNGIPVIASNKGNLSHTVGEGGIIIQEVENINSWIKSIKFLNNSANYRIYQKKAKKSAQRFNPELEVDKIQELLEKII